MSMGTFHAKGKRRVDCAKEKFATYQVAQETGAVSPSTVDVSEIDEGRTVGDRSSIDCVRASRTDVNGASVSKYVGNCLATDMYPHQGSAVSPSVSAQICVGVDHIDSAATVSDCNRPMSMGTFHADGNRNRAERNSAHVEKVSEDSDIFTYTDH